MFIRLQPVRDLALVWFLSSLWFANASLNPPLVAYLVFCLMKLIAPAMVTKPSASKKPFPTIPKIINFSLPKIEGSGLAGSHNQETVLTVELIFVFSSGQSYKNSCSPTKRAGRHAALIHIKRLCGEKRQYQRGICATDLIKGQDWRLGSVQK